MILAAHLDAVEARVVGQFGHAERDTEILPVAIGLEHPEAEPLAIGALVMIPQRIVRVVASRARELVAEDGLARNVKPLKRDHRAEMRGVDFLPDAVAFA